MKAPSALWWYLDPAGSRLHPAAVDVPPLVRHLAPLLQCVPQPLVGPRRLRTHRHSVIRHGTH